jgi:hypothetical protein
MVVGSVQGVLQLFGVLPRLCSDQADNLRAATHNLAGDALLLGRLTAVLGDLALLLGCVPERLGSCGIFLPADFYGFLRPHFARSYVGREHRPCLEQHRVERRRRKASRPLILTGDGFRAQGDAET